MEILKREILPLFELTGKKERECVSDKLMNTDVNKYSLYVNLKDIYLNNSQTHQIIIADKILEYTIPLHYHEIILQGKGYQYDDIQINIYSKRDPDYIRVNSNDLLYFKKISIEEWKMNEYTFKHLDGEEITINLKAPKLQKIPDKGLPKADHSKGYLYIWIDVNINQDDIKDEMYKINDQINEEQQRFRKEQEYKNRESVEKDYLLEILNYHSNSNIIFKDNENNATTTINETNETNENTE